MSNIDLTQLISANDKTCEALRQHTEKTKKAYREHILAVVGQSAQMNMAAAATTFDADDREIYAQILGWIGEMQRMCRISISAPSVDHGAPDSWPVLSQTARRFVDRF